MTLCLQVSKIVKWFGGVHAVNAVSFDASDGEVLGLIGPNGSGKSTVLNLIMAFYKPDSGQIIFAGREITGLSSERVCRLGISRMFQRSRPFNNMTAIDNVRVAYHFGGTRSQNSRKTQPISYLKEVGLAEKAHVSAQRLTLVERRLLEFAVALASEPKLLLLDEPFAGLDASEIAMLTQIILGLKRRNLTLLIVEHKIKQLFGISDRVVVLSQGEKLFEGSPSEVLSDKRVVEAYLGRKHDLPDRK